MSPVLVQLPQAALSQKVVEHLEELLEQARSGEIHSVATAVVYQNEDTQTRWALGSNVRGGVMLAAIMMLQRDWQDRCLEERG